MTSQKYTTLAFQSSLIMTAHIVASCDAMWSVYDYLRCHDDFAHESQSSASTMPIVPAWVTAISSQVHTMLVTVVIIRLTRSPEREANRLARTHPNPIAFRIHVVGPSPHVHAVPLGWNMYNDRICTHYSIGLKYSYVSTKNVYI